MLMSDFIPAGLGWSRDLPDRRDYTPRHEEVARWLEALKPRGPRPRRVDWRTYCPGIYDQQELDASAANACAGLLRYCERRGTGKFIEPSRLFIHQAARQLMQATGKCGPGLRMTWKAVLRFGAPPEPSWPYSPSQAGREPEAFAYAFAREFAAISYVRLDGRGESGASVLETVKSFLAAGFASVFGFPVCTCVTCEADIPFPTVYDTVRGGQAVMAVGYDDSRRIRSDKGALLIRNSWGTGWGDQGYGWLPYTYLREHLASDFWTLLKPDWLTSGEFARPA
jgi:C1A family cysteine protease